MMCAVPFLGDELLLADFFRNWVAFVEFVTSNEIVVIAKIKSLSVASDGGRIRQLKKIPWSGREGKGEDPNQTKGGKREWKRGHEV